MSSETKSRAELIAKWRAKAKLAKASGRWAEAIEGEICADDLEALESSSSADPGTTGAEGPSMEEIGMGDLAWSLAHAALKEKWSDAKLGPAIAKFAMDWYAEAAATQRAPVTPPGRDEALEGLVENWRRRAGRAAKSTAVTGSVRYEITMCADELERALAAAKEPRG